LEGGGPLNAGPSLTPGQIQQAIWQAKAFSCALAAKVSK